MKNGLIFLPLISAFIFIFASCGHNFHVLEGRTWGTTYRIVYAGSPSLADSVTEQLGIIDSELSMFNPSSVVCAINSGKCDVADTHFRTVFECAQQVSRWSGGRYDCTIAPLVDAWGFGVKKTVSTPDSATIASLLASVGIAECSIDNNGIIHRKTTDTRFDFSSIAKGFGVDCVAAMLRRNGVHDYMVEIGGEVSVSGKNPMGKPWHIQVDAPVAGEGHTRHCLLELGPQPVALASSGNYRNYRVDAGGNVFGHTISPLTGYPAPTEVLGVSVLADNCMMADACATACMTGSIRDAEECMAAAGVSGMIIFADSTGELRTKKIGCLPTTENP